jgi:glucose/arabinose dehydrogenase
MMMSVVKRAVTSPDRRYAVAALLLATTLTAAIAGAATLPAGFTESQLAAGLSNPTAMAFAPDGRLFVCEQGGRLRIIKNGALLSAPFVQVTVSSVGERGLLGVTFDPGFAQNGFVYVYYTATSPNIHNRVSRFTANGDVAVPGSEVVLLDLNPLSSATNHNGGAMHVGPDGMLYIAVGENANGANAQTLNNLLGKMLRINRNGTIPTDNPFFNQATGNNRAIWALGLRNPFTFTFQPGTGRMFINDVGQNTTEEVNDGIRGSNYGWPTTEGPTTNPNFRSPLFSYGHGSSNTTGCAITGGAFYNSPVQQFPTSFNGSYFFADFCSGWIRRLTPPGYNAATAFATGISSPVDLRIGPDGALYYLARGNGAVFRVQSGANVPPTISQHPANRTVVSGQPATFSVVASGTPPLQFQWQRNGANIPGATASSFTLPSAGPGDNGATFRVVVSNSFGTVTSNSATLTVTGGQPVMGMITSPANGTLYRGGETFTFSGTGTGSSGGPLPASAFTWQVDFHHDTHTHPFVPATTGVTSGQFTIPTQGETADNVFYRVILTVREGALSDTRTVDVVPRKSTITLATQPAGLQLTLDGQPVTTPVSVLGVEGIVRSLGVVSPQTVNGTTFAFASWSDGGAATHNISTPINDTTFTATFQPSTMVFSDDFSVNRGWATNAGGTDTATTGAWQRGDPQPTTSGGAAMQLAGGVGEVNCLITGLTAGAAVGTNDLDGGVTSILSPPIALPAGATLSLSFQFYFAHLGNSSTDDFFRASIVGPTGTSTMVFEERGSTAVDAAAWAPRTVNLTTFAGQTVRIRFEAADAGTGSLVEAGVDAVTITRQ